MHTYLIEMLVCPVCHGELRWNLTERTEDRIETGSAHCSSCAATYPVQEGIGVFLPPERQSDGMWEQGNRQMQYVDEHPRVERQLLGLPLEALNPADQHFRALALEARGKYTDLRSASSCWQNAYLCNPEPAIGRRQ